MVPGAIRQLLAIYSLAEPELNDYFVKELKDDGLIQWTNPRGYQPTERGHKMVEMLCDTPLPVQKWLDPRQIKEDQ